MQGHVASLGIFLLGQPQMSKRNNRANLVCGSSLAQRVTQSFEKNLKIFLDQYLAYLKIECINNEVPKIKFGYSWLNRMVLLSLTPQTAAQCWVFPVWFHRGLPRLSCHNPIGGSE